MYNVQCTMYNVQCTMYNVHLLQPPPALPIHIIEKQGRIFFRKGRGISNFLIHIITLLSILSDDGLSVQYNFDRNTYNNPASYTI